MTSARAVLTCDEVIRDEFQSGVLRRKMRTYFPKKGDIEPRWFIIDAEGKILGRLSTAIATILSGKRKPMYTPFLDTGDHVIVINAEKIVLTGKKESDKIYRHHSQYPGGLKERSARSIRAEKPEMMIEEAVWGMLPKNRLGRKMLKKLKVYRGANHPHEAQKPERIDVAE
jgi:large subunit ribosomal protein L13